MLQREAKNTLFELTNGLDIQKDSMTKTATKNKIVPLNIARTAGFVEAGSGLMMSVDNKALGVKAGSFWEVKTGSNGEQYLERMSNDFDTEENEKLIEQKKSTASAFPDFFSTPNEMYEWFQENNMEASVSDIGNGVYIVIDKFGNRHKYREFNRGVEKIGGTDGSEFNRRASHGNEPPIHTIPESIELDVSNKLEEQSKQRGLSLSEQSDKTLIEEDLKKKVLDPLSFD